MCEIIILAFSARSRLKLQIMRLTCCLNMAFNLTKPKVGLICLHYITWKALWPFTDHFADALFAKTLNASMTLWRRSDVQKFDTDAILFREIQFKKRDI